MAEYTIELRRIIEAGIPIFDFPYNFYDESKRAEFEKKFIQHFYFREIGCEAVERFKWYLRDKMETVFPYYNELFNTANIEYSILNNYNLTEEFTTTRENQGKTSGVSSTRGQVFDNQNSESNQNRKVDTTGTANTTGNDTDTESTVTDSNETVNGTTTNNQTINGSASKNVNKKFLDTPQGLTDLTDAKYLTTLNQDTESDSNEQTVNGGGTSENKTVGKVEATRNGKKDTTVNQTTEGNETTSDTVTATTSSEQRNTQDNNTRMYTDNKQTETHKLTRIGNIGVDTDSDMIEKHIRLQKTLRQIELLFFNECEDLFMLVY